MCLGHQALGYAYGGKVVRAGQADARQNVADPARRKNYFLQLPQPSRRRVIILFWLNARASPSALKSAPGPGGEIMGLRHKRIPALEGVQFHPESILTIEGKKLLANFWP